MSIKKVLEIFGSGYGDGFGYGYGYGDGYGDGYGQENPEKAGLYVD